MGSPAKESNPFEIIGRMSVATSLLFVDHATMAMSFRSEAANLHWVTHAAVLAEPEVAKKGATILAKIQQDMKAFQEYEGGILDDLHDFAMKGDPRLGAVSKRGREVFTALEARLNERTKEVEELLSEAMRLSGAHVQIPAHLIRPRRWKRVVELLERIVTGYARERLKE